MQEEFLSNFLHEQYLITRRYSILENIPKSKAFHFVFTFVLKYCSPAVKLLVIFAVRPLAIKHQALCWALAACVWLPLQNLVPSAIVQRGSCTTAHSSWCRLLLGCRRSYVIFKIHLFFCLQRALSGFIHYSGFFNIGEKKKPMALVTLR